MAAAKAAILAPAHSARSSSTMPPKKAATAPQAWVAQLTGSWAWRKN